MFSRLKSLWPSTEGTKALPRDVKNITFRVDDVTPAAAPLRESTLGESLEYRSASKIIVMPDRDVPALAAEGYSAPPSRGLPIVDPKDAKTEAPASQPCMNPLIEAVHLAFSQHRPLILSPDCIWLTIVQGFGHHVHENAENLRDRIVRHQGKKALVVFAASLAPDQWPLLISQFSSMIHANSDAVLYETLMCDFSTTTPTIRTASEVALMDVYERYFEYIISCVCGIPQITLQGTPEDWQRMRDRVEVLATYDLQWWISRLIPILDEFVATAKGRPNRDFWQAVYKPKQAYGAEVATGWITDLFPYLGDPPTRRKNNLLEKARIDWVFPASSQRMFATGISPKQFPSGLSRAAVKVKLPGNSEQEVDLLGGFFGVGQNPKDNALFPVISWALTEKLAPPVISARGRRMMERANASAPSSTPPGS